MTDKQLELLIAHYGGLMFGIVHLARFTAKETGVDVEALAESFRLTAKGIGPGFNHQAILQNVLEQIATGITSATSTDEIQNNLRDALH